MGSSAINRRKIMTRGSYKGLLVTGCLAALLCIGTRASAEGNGGERPRGPLVLENEGYFFVGGHYFDAADGSGQFMADQMFVEFEIPRPVRHPYPIVMIHGGGQTGTNFEGTPDNREGWAEFFLRLGYAVYIVDQPGRGDSAYQADVDGPTSSSNTDFVETHFTAVQDFDLWPQSLMHTQWPGSGLVGDPIFDQFYASQVPGIASDTVQSLTTQTAGAALLDKIGPAIILTHSQSAHYGWLIADARHDLVKALVELEPATPPYQAVAFIGPPTYFQYGAISFPWGLTATPITYSPPVSDPSQLSFVQQTTPDAPDLIRCWMQAPNNVHTLPTLQGIPILLQVSASSDETTHIHCTSKYLTQAGVPHTFVRLAKIGIEGGGHMEMLEKDNLQNASIIAAFLARHGL
jgi:pimeloyl-ACP methyl ester carboxylesterase